jgi:hypothetical protein
MGRQGSPFITALPSVKTSPCTAGLPKQGLRPPSHPSGVVGYCLDVTRPIGMAWPTDGGARGEVFL